MMMSALVSAMVSQQMVHVDGRGRFYVIDLLADGRVSLYCDNLDSVVVVDSARLGTSVNINGMI